MENVESEPGPHIFKTPQGLSQPYHTINFHWITKLEALSLSLSVRVRKRVPTFGLSCRGSNSGTQYIDNIWNALRSDHSSAKSNR